MREPVTIDLDELLTLIRNAGSFGARFRSLCIAMGLCDDDQDFPWSPAMVEALAELKKRGDVHRTPGFNGRWYAMTEPKP